MIMRRNLIMTGLGAALIAGTVAVSAVAGAAPATTNHTIKLIATQTANHPFSNASAASAATDRSHGKVVGYNILSKKFTSTSGVILGAFAVQGGLLYFRIPASNSMPLHGKITGGAGKFAGVSGTITATKLNNARKQTAVTIVYHH
jgi:hypothetical protein